MKTPQFEHQKIGTAALVENPYFALFDQMGVGKSKQVIDAACILAEQGKIDTVIVVAPASVRCVWFDPEIGEIKKHCSLSCEVYEFHQKVKKAWQDGNGIKISFIITNYEFLRGINHLIDLCKILENRKILLVLDESSYIKNRTAAQTKAVLKLRKHCARCVILNGTPVTNSPLDLWSQMQVLSPAILEKRYKNFYAFRASFCEIKTMHFGPRRFPQVVGYKNLEKLAKVVAPYVLRREKKDCLDLPPKLYTEREVALTPESWKRYCELKKDALMSLPDGNVRMEPNLAVRFLRLAQLTSGMVGGEEE
jgi:SNF2 family DNA or RNA helicase